MDHRFILVRLLVILVLVYMFVVGIGAMGHSFMLLGQSFADSVIKATASPIIALFVGILATSLVQSSSTTTSLIVGLVASGALSAHGAVFMVMGANVGTTITSTIVSLAHVTRSDEFRRTFAAATVHDFFNIMAVVALFTVELATGFLTSTSSAIAGALEGVGGLKTGGPDQRRHYSGGPGPRWVGGSKRLGITDVGGISDHRNAIGDRACIAEPGVGAY